MGRWGWIIMLGIALSGCGAGKRVPGLEHFRAQARAGHLSVSFLATSLNLDGCTSLPIPGLTGATLGCAPNLQGPGTLFQLTLPLAGLAGNASTGLPRGGLPDGRALPGISGGVLPRTTERVTGLDLTLYLGSDVVGFFLPIPLRTASGLFLTFLRSINIEDERGNRIGKGHAVPPGANGEGSGILILLPVSGGNSNLQEK